MRFCMVTTFYPPYHFGGDALHVYRLSQALAERGHAVEVVHSLDAYRLQHPAEPEARFEHHPNVRLHPLATAAGGLSALAAHQLGRPGPYARRLRAVLESGHFDAIHFHNISLVGGPGVLELGRGVKLYTAHEYWLFCPTHTLFAFGREACTEKRCLRCTVLSYRRPPQLWRLGGALRRALGQVDCMVMPSQFAIDRHRAEGIERPMRRLPCFVPRLTGREPPAGVALPPRPFFLYVGRLETLKGVHELVELFRGYGEADLLLVGSGSERLALEARARGLPHVRFAGALLPDAIAGLYARAIALVVPSLCYEIFGLTLAESMSCGTPVIARRIGALKESLEESGGGLGFDSMAECREAMERLRTDPALRAELSRRASEAAERLWSREASLDRYLALVGELNQQRGRAIGAVNGS